MVAPKFEVGIQCLVCHRFSEDPCDTIERSRGCPNFGTAPVDQVNHPPHYAGKVETIDYILQVTADYPGQEAALVANVLKYVSRAPRKGDKVKDLQKAQWYLNKLVEITN